MSGVDGWTNESVGEIVMEATGVMSQADIALIPETQIHGLKTCKRVCMTLRY